MPGMFETIAIVSDIEVDLDSISSWAWVDTTDDELRKQGAKAFSGKGRRWSFLVVIFGDHQEGTATTSNWRGSPLICRLPKALALRARSLVERRPQ